MTKAAKIIITTALMLGISLAAFDATIVSTALPSIVGKLGGLSLYSWIFSAYALASTATVPIYGKLADLYGRKPIFLFGSALFLLGSILCGAAQSMEQLIVFRAVQGLGAGAVLPIVYTIIGDLYALKERARVQGLSSAVWGISSLLGPALGGLLVDYCSWRWIFYLNIPFGLASGLLLAIYLKESINRKQPQLDYLGALTLTGGMVALLFVLLQGGMTWAWNSWQSLSLLAVSLVLLALFLCQERWTAEPILPLTLFTNRVIAASSLGRVIVGILMFGITAYVPLFVQGVKGGSATSAGMMLAPLLLAWPIAAMLCGKMVVHSGYRFTVIWGMACMAIGTGMVTLFTPDTGVPFIVMAMLVTGVGLGLASTALIMSVQSAVPWHLRGVATASTQFFRTIGGSIGMAVMGTLLNVQIATRFPPIFARFPKVGARFLRGGTSANVLLTPGLRVNFPGAFVHQLQAAFAQSLFFVYGLTFALAALGLAAMFLLPSRHSEQNLSQSVTQATRTVEEVARDTDWVEPAKRDMKERASPNDIARMWRTAEQSTMPLQLAADGIVER